MTTQCRETFHFRIDCLLLFCFRTHIYRRSLQKCCILFGLSALVIPMLAAAEQRRLVGSTSSPHNFFFPCVISLRCLTVPCDAPTTPCRTGDVHAGRPTSAGTGDVHADRAPSAEVDPGVVLHEMLAKDQEIRELRGQVAEVRDVRSCKQKLVLR